MVLSLSPLRCAALRLTARPLRAAAAGNARGWSSDTVSQWGTSTSEPLNEQYTTAKSYLQSKKLPPSVPRSSVFANAELNLSDIDVYGFDYDYTLATYKMSVEKDIHDIAKKILVEKFKFPKEIINLEYDPDFSIRGLHYDIDKGLLLKLDSICQIQFGAVYKGRTRLTDEEVLAAYDRRRIPQDFLDDRNNLSRHSLVHLVDVFANPVASLLSGIIDFFEEHEIKYTPEAIYLDTREAINRAHPMFHEDVIHDPSVYLERQPELVAYLDMLKAADKKLFLITNSPFKLVNAGMTHMVGQTDWREIFDVIIVNAKKPFFFTHQMRHIREFFPETNTLMWDPVKELRPGRVYSRGNLHELQQLTGWRSDSVLYFGDHPYADLADLSLNYGWRTGAIIREVEDELEVMNSDKFKWGINWSTTLQLLIEDNQGKASKSEEDAKVLAEWKEELRQIRRTLKASCNPYFGSIFRTHQNSTHFSRRLFRFADVYTSRITNFHQYPLDHTFYPRRGALPHEFRSWFV